MQSEEYNKIELETLRKKAEATEHLIVVMKNLQRGFFGLQLIIIIAVFAIGVGYYIYTQRNSNSRSSSLTEVTIPTNNISSNNSTASGVSVVNKSQPKAPRGYLTPDTSSLPTGYVYLSDYGTSGSMVIYSYVKDYKAKITFTQGISESYQNLLSDFSNRKVQPERVVLSFNNSVVLEGLNTDGSHRSYRLLNNNSGKILEIYAEGDQDVTPQVLKDLLQHMYY